MGGNKSLLRGLRRFGVLLRFRLIEKRNLISQCVFLLLAGLTKPSTLGVSDAFSQLIY
jgi:hypothetical protein